MAWSTIVNVSWCCCWTISAGSGSSSNSSIATGDTAVGDTGRGKDVGEGAVGDTGVGDAGAGDGGGESGTATGLHSGTDVNSAHAAHSQSISTPSLTVVSLISSKVRLESKPFGARTTTLQFSHPLS